MSAACRRARTRPDEWTRHRISERFRAGASQRAIARELGLSRKTVRRVLRELAAQREEGRDELPPQPGRGVSQLDEHQRTIEELLARYPDIKATRVHEELRQRGFTGGYTIVRDRVRQLRPSSSRRPVLRFETAPGAQARRLPPGAQAARRVDYSTYTIDFETEGRRRVHLFGYLLAYSRRQYLRFVEHQDFPTTVREHLRAFEHVGGVAATCLYDNMKVVVSDFDGEEPIYNLRFLAFATHYGFRVWACRRRRPQTKGKIERPFGYVESSLLNGRTFRSLDHLNQVTAQWLAEVSDQHLHRTTGERPIDRHAQELPHLIPLPRGPYDPSPVVYRVVDAEHLVSWRGNRYSVPWHHIGQMLPLRIGESELVAYSPTLEVVARHPLFPEGQTGRTRIQPEHVPRPEGPERLERLRERFEKLGPLASRFLDGLLGSRRYGRDEASKLLALLGTYAQADGLRALERAVRYRAFSLRAVERVLAVTARPKSLLDTLADDVGQRLAQVHPHPPVPPRPTSDYQLLLNLEPDHDQESTLEGQPQPPQEESRP